MDVSEQQKKILEAAMTAHGAFKPKYIVEKSGLGYNIVSPQLERLVDKKILIKDKQNKTYTATDEARKPWTHPTTEERKETIPPVRQ